MGQIDEIDLERKALNDAIQYNKGFLDALKAVESGDIFISTLLGFPIKSGCKSFGEQIELVSKTLEDHEERFNDLRKIEKRIKRKKKK